MDATYWDHDRIRRGPRHPARAAAYLPWRRLAGRSCRVVTARAADGGGKVIVGIDAGGSSTRVRAQAGSVLVFEGAGGPGNPVMTGPETVRASYHAALGGCPAASRVA